MERLNTGKSVILGIVYLIHRQPEPFDWYQVYSGIKDILSQYVTKKDKILNVGSGNSSKSL
jgi:hypothetical protein